MKSKSIGVLAVLLLCIITASAQKYSLAPTTNGTVIVQFTNNYFNGVSTLQGRLGRKWVPLDNFFTTQLVGQVELPLPGGYSLYRLRSMSVVPGNAFSRLALAYGNISTLAGTGPQPTGTNLWLPEYEGTTATNVPLSHPRAAVADERGNIYVVEQGSHAVSIISNGVIRTVVGQFGTRGEGFLELGSGVEFPATDFPLLRNPTGLHYQNGRLYILDSGNGRVLRYNTTNGTVSKLFSASAVFGETAVFPNGGSLTVTADEQEAYFTDGTILRYWDASELENGSGGLSVEAQGFANLTDVKINPQGRRIVVDNGANALYRVRGPDNDFRQDLQAGTGLTRGRSVGDAREVALPGPTAIAYLPIGGYLISTDGGARAWYVDSEGDTAPLIFGRAPTATKPGAHAGDGRWFRRGGRSPKVSNIHYISVAPNGDIIMVEGGYVRRIEFLRAKP